VLHDVFLPGEVAPVQRQHVAVDLDDNGLPQPFADKPRKRLGQCRVEGPGVDLVGHSPNNVGATARAVTSWTVRVVGVEPGQDAGAVQEVVDQSVNCNHAGADLEPAWPTTTASNQNRRQHHHQDLVGNGIDMPERPDHSLDHLADPVSGRWVISGCELVIDPGDQVTVGHVANEQVQTLGKLVEPTVSEPMGWQRTAVELSGLGTGPSGLLIPAAVKLPIAGELRAGWRDGEVGAQVLPGRPAIPLHVAFGNFVRDPLIAQTSLEPVEHRCGVPDFDGSGKLAIAKLVHQVSRAS
jgi:hypothetical protein